MPASGQEVECTGTVVVDSFLSVHRFLGPGLLESVYQACIAQELRGRGLRVETEVPVPLHYRGVTLDVAFRLDMLVDDSIIIENKAVQTLSTLHASQLLTYLRLTGYRLGFLVNWNVPLIKNGIHRIVNRL